MNDDPSTPAKPGFLQAAGRLTRMLLPALFGAAIGYFFVGSLLPDSFITAIKANLDAGQWWLLLPLALAAFLLVIAVHELAHLLTGLLQGFRFQWFVVGPFGLRRDEDTDRIRLYLNKDLSMAGGLAATTPTDDHPDNIRKFARVIIAGPLASLLLAALLLVVFSGSTGLMGFFVSLAGLLSAVIFLVTILPFGSSTFMSDGKRFLRLLRPETREIEMAIMRLTAVYTRTRSYEDMQVADIDRMKQDTTPMLHTMAYFYSFLHYFCRGELQKAATEEALYREKAQAFPAALRRMMDKEITRVQRQFPRQAFDNES